MVQTQFAADAEEPSTIALNLAPGRDIALTSNCRPNVGAPCWRNQLVGPTSCGRNHGTGSSVFDLAATPPPRQTNASVVTITAARTASVLSCDDTSIPPDFP